MSDAVQVSAPVAIRAEISLADPDTCKFTLSQSLSQNGEHFFAGAEQAAGSPLVARLFELPGVAHVLVADRVIAVGKTRETAWPELKPLIAAVLRSELRSGVPLVLRPQTGPGVRGRSAAEISSVVQLLLDREVNPALAAHSGSIALVEVRDYRLYIRMSGGCQGCAGSQATLRQGFERRVRGVAPEVTEIIDVTDHATGETPYYRDSGTSALA